VVLPRTQRAVTMTDEARLRPPARAGLAAIRLYQRLRSGRPSGCRFVPSCSDYTREAIEEYGLVRGVRLGTWRLLRCNPFGGSGVDLVPLRVHHDHGGAP
jgi:uncharacterized protein